jgi:predicted dinucleotide-binding enzyme
MRIAVLGAGKVGEAPGAALRRAGHDIVFGVRSPDAARPGSDVLDRGGN